MKLSVNTGFLVNRYPTPYQWAKEINKLEVKHVQLTADLFSPFYDDQILERYVKEINFLKKEYNFSITSLFTGAFTRVNHFCHPEEEVRNYWLKWFKRFSDYAVKLGAKKVGSHIGILSIDDNLNRRQIFQERCINIWKELALYGKDIGLEELTWEHMSIEREQGHTCQDINYLLEGLKESAIPIKLCLDPDHGDLTSQDSKDYEPYGLLKQYLPFSSQLHLKQTSLDKRKNGTFTRKNNSSGLIHSDKVISLLKKYIAEDNKKNFEIILELNAREREPDDSNICKEVKESLDYWRKSLVSSNLLYE